MSLAEACIEWHTDEATALKWIADGLVHANTDPDGSVWVPVREVARWQGVLGQNGRLT